MATTSGSTTDNSSADQLKSALATADSKVAQGIQNLQSVHQARLAQANRTVAVLKAQYGADDPRVKTAEAAGAAHTTSTRSTSHRQQQVARAPLQHASASGGLHTLR